MNEEQFERILSAVYAYCPEEDAKALKVFKRKADRWKAQNLVYLGMQQPVINVYCDKPKE